MLKLITIACRNFHFPTCILCCANFLPFVCTNPDLEVFIKQMWGSFGVLLLIISCLRSIYRKETFSENTDRILHTYILICLVETAIALCQLVHIIPSPHLFFRITGSFRHPIEYAMMLAISIPICVFFCLKSNGRKWHLITIILSIGLILSDSRICIASAIISSIIVGYIEQPSIRHFFSQRKTLFPILLLTLISILFLYLYKRDSANGRFLIWLVSENIIADKLFLGWGRYGFSSSYMLYQAEYLTHNPNIFDPYIADNISHPFNEFILVTINYGLVGLSLLLILISTIILGIIRYTQSQKSLYLSTTFSILIISMFSYPSQIALIWLIVTFLICSIISIYCLKIQILRLPILCLIFSIIPIYLLQYKSIYYEWQWQKLVFKPSSNSEQSGCLYTKLYPKLNNNASFLYNYGAWLHKNNSYNKSLSILKECSAKYNDYFVQLLIASNYLQLNKADSAIYSFNLASQMIPNRFLPLYYNMKIYDECGDSIQAHKVAREIIHKREKVKNSLLVQKIKKEASLYLKSDSREHSH